MRQINHSFIILLLITINVVGVEIKSKKGVYKYQGERKVLHLNILDAVKKNDNFRKEIITGKNSQVVLMSVPVGGEIGEEIHKVDQILIFLEGSGLAIIEGKSSQVLANHLVFVPAGTKHNFKNTGAEPLKLYTVYAPPQHKPGTVQKTKPTEY